MGELRVGVLALQGAVSEHLLMLARAGATAVAVTKAEQLPQLDGLIIPGGESGPIASLLMRMNGFLEALNQFAKEQKPLFGTSGGASLLAARLDGEANQTLGFMHMDAMRNAFDQQPQNFEAILPIAGVAADFPAVFIRAPHFAEIAAPAQILAKYDNKNVCVRQRHFLACAFHPELTDDDRLHRYFLQMIREYQQKTNF